MSYYDMGPNTEESNGSGIVGFICGVIAAVVTRIVCDDDGNTQAWVLGVGLVVGILAFVGVNILDSRSNDRKSEMTACQRVTPSIINPGKLPNPKSVRIPRTVEEMFPDQGPRSQ